MSTLYLLNSPILPNYGRFDFSGPIAIDEARGIAASGFVSAIGHEGAATLFSHLLGQKVEAVRQRICLAPGDRALVLRLERRLPEGTVMNYEELADLPYELALLTRVD